MDCTRLFVVVLSAAVLSCAPSGFEFGRDESPSKKYQAAKVMELNTWWSQDRIYLFIGASGRPYGDGVHIATAKRGPAGDELQFGVVWKDDETLFIIKEPSVKLQLLSDAPVVDGQAIAVKLFDCSLPYKECVRAVRSADQPFVEAGGRTLPSRR